MMEIGRGALDETLDNLDEDEQQRSAHRSHLVDQTGHLIDYNEEYAHTVARYLLEEGILIPVTRTTLSDGSSTSLVTPNCVTDEEQDTEMASSLDSLHHGRRPPGGHEGLEVHLREALPGVGEDGVGNNLAVPSLHEIYPAADTSNRRTTGRGDSHHPHHHHSRRGGMGMHASNSSHHSNRPAFSATMDAYYKFAASEDAEYVSLLQSQILMASSISSGGSHRPPRSASTPQPSRERGATENQDFLAAKRGTLYLVLDLLTQRARKERVAKQFLASPRTLVVQDQRRLEESVTCDLIFKM